MATENTLSQQLLDLLATRNVHPEMLDKMGKPTDAENAKTFTFDYTSGAGKNYGTMVIVLDAGNDMKIMYGDNLGKTMEGDDKQEFFDFIGHLNQVATRNRWTHTNQDISQLKHTMQGMAAIQEGLFEGYYGTRKISYAGQPTEARLQIVHSQPLGENDARYRHIAKMFIETADGERFKLGFKSLAGGKAMLEHVRQGGKPYDVRGCHITETVNEIAVLNRFNRASATRIVEGSTQELITEAQAYYQTLRENLKHMATSRGYTKYFESWHPATINEQEGVVDNIKTLFIEQSIDSRIEAALPLLAKIQQRGQQMKEADIFESWISNLGEGTWSLPETPEQLDKLKTLMTKELIVGPDATNATEQLYDLIGDDILFDRLQELADRDPRANAWNDTEVMARIKELGIEMPEPTAPGNPAEPQTGATAPVAAEVPPNPAPEQAVRESINAMRKAAGLAEAILDESGETLDHVLARFKHEVKQFETTGELDSDLYHALFDYYSDKGEMPYGVAKARDGDPYNWVSDKLGQALGVNESNSGMIMPEADMLNTFEVMSGFDAPTVEGACNMTHEGEYCPEHGLAECGGTVAGGMAPVIGEGRNDVVSMHKRLNEGWKGALTGGTLGTLGGAALGTALGGPVGGAVGAAFGGTAGQMGGDKVGDKIEKAIDGDDQQLNENPALILGAIVAGARALGPRIIPLLARLGGRGAASAGAEAGAAAAGRAAATAGAEQAAASLGARAAQAAGQVAKGGAEIAAKNAGKIGLGAGIYDIADTLAKSIGPAAERVYTDAGSAAKALSDTVGNALSQATLVDVAKAMAKYALPLGVVLAVMYGGKKLIDKAIGEDGSIYEDDDPMNYNAAITGSYYESKDSDVTLARIKSLALLK